MNNIIDQIKHENLTNRDCGLFPTLAFDLLGHLIFSDNGFRRVSGLPSPLEFLRLTPYEEEGAKYPWGINYLKLQTHISSVIQALPPRLAERYKKLYPGNLPTTIDEIAFPYNVKSISNSDEDVITIIQSLYDSSISNEIKESTRSTLNEHGICEIPVLLNYHSKYHQSEKFELKRGNIIKVGTHGWVRSSTVLIKSKVSLSF